MGLLRRHQSGNGHQQGRERQGSPRASRLASTGDHGNTVHQIMADYESLRGGGSGYLRLVEFQPDGTSVQFRTYSPVLDQYLTDDANQFTLAIEPLQSRP